MPKAELSPKEQVYNWIHSRYEKSTILTSEQPILNDTSVIVKFKDFSPAQVVSYDFDMQKVTIIPFKPISN